MAQGKNGRPLRVAFFSGNYNYVKDGANQALNRLVGRLLARGLEARIYSPVVAEPAFPPIGTLVGVPSVPLPGRSEYRMALGLPRAARADLRAFAPDVVHLAAPDWMGFAAKKWALRHGVPVVASVHTRFETYFAYYRMGYLRRSVEYLLRRFYRDLVEIYAPSEGMAELLRSGGYSKRVKIWSRGVDRRIFRPEARDLQWLRRTCPGMEGPVIGFVGRLVPEKGLDVVAASMALLRQRGVPHHLLVVGEGPARQNFEAMVPEASFTGFLSGEELGRAFASFDVFLNPSVTEAFGNVTLEAMASAVPTVGAAATGTSSLVVDHVSGRLITPGDAVEFADALQAYCADPELRRTHGLAALERARAYDWDSINDSVIDRYFQLARCA